MIRSVLAAAFRRPAFMALLAAGAAALGLTSYASLARDVYPDLSAPVFNVIVQNSAMAPEELEIGVSLPIELAMAGVPGVRRVRSRLEPGVVQVTIEFEPDWDYYLSRQLVGERLAMVTGAFPPGTETPLLSGVTARLNEIMEISLGADRGAMDLMSLRDLAEFEVKNRLVGVPGVALVERIGGFLRQFQVQVDPVRLRERGVHFKEVLRAARAASENAAGSFIVRGASEWNVRALGRTDDVAALGRTLVARRRSVPITLGDLADIREAPATRRGLAHAREGEIVSLRVIKQFGVDTVKVSRAVRAALGDIRSALPPGVRLTVAYDQGAVVERTLRSVGVAVGAGAAVVVLVLLGLLGRWRATALVALTIPFSVALAGLVFQVLGVGLNAMTLGGIAIAVGLLADAAIIMVENVAHRLGEPDAGPKTALSAAQEVGRPIFFAIAILVAVFLPLVALQGLEGKLYRPLALAVISSMVGALLLTLTVVPPVAARVLGRGGDREVWFIRNLKRLYRPALDFAMRHAGWVRLTTLVITVPAIFLALRIGTEFVPEIDEGALMVQTLAPPEASLDYVDRVNRRVEEILRKMPDVAEVVRRTGRSEETGDPMPHTLSDVLVVLREGADPREVRAKLRRRLSRLPGLNVLVTTPLNERIDEGLGGTPADLVVRIFGNDLEVLRDLAQRAEAIARGTPGLADVRPEPGGIASQLHVRIDRESAARYGVRAGDVADLVRASLAGEKVGNVWRGQRRYDLVVRLAEKARATPAAIGTLSVDTPGGGHVLLREVATVTHGSGLSNLRRERLSRRLGIEARVEGRDLGGAAAELEQRLRSGLKLPPGTFLEVGGRVEAKERAERSLLTSIAVSLALVTLLLYLALGRFSEVLVIVLTLPDAFVGGIVALWIAGESWNVSSLVGLIGLFGIAVQNSLVLIAQTRELTARGRPFEEALREASIGRVRPKLMTAGTAIFGLLPILLLPGGGTEVERPLAIVLIGGLLTSTLFTLLALPTFYELVHKLTVGRQDSRS